MKRIIELVLVALISGGLVALIFYKEDQPITQITDTENILPIQKASFRPESTIDFISSANTAVDQVVHVMSSGSKSVSSPFDFMFGVQPQSIPTMSSGSGVIISKDGYVITNNHVIKGANEIDVIMNNKQSYRAKVIGRDQSIDLALLKIEGNDFSAMPYGNSDEIEIGEWVLAIGNPFNLKSTVTAGIVSAKARSLGMSSRTSLESFIQTDAAVNPGNSGGALVNTRGELIGINTAIASRTGSYVGYSFAIPVNLVKKVISDLMEYGEVQRALLGVVIYELNAQTADQLGIDLIEGVYVKDVNLGSAAADADIESGDIITHIDGVEIKSSSELYEQIGIHRPGDKIKLKVNRDGKDKIFNLTLKNRNNKITMETSENIDLLGATFKALNKEELGLARLAHGIQISELFPGKLRMKGVRKGFIVSRVNHKKVHSVDELKKIINQSQGGVLFEGAYPNGKRAYYAIGLEK